MCASCVDIIVMSFLSNSRTSTRESNTGCMSIIKLDGLRKIILLVVGSKPTINGPMLYEILLSFWEKPILSIAIISIIWVEGVIRGGVS